MPQWKNAPHIHEPGYIELCRTVDAYMADRRKRFIRGFAAEVIAAGYGAMAPARRGQKPETWQAVGRRLYGAREFHAAIRELLAEREKSREAV